MMVPMCIVEGCTNEVLKKSYCPRHYMKWYRGTLVVPPCSLCGKETGGKTSAMKYCSECRAKVNRESWLKNERRRRTIKRGLEYDEFTRTDLYEMDEGICYLCRSPVVFEEMHVDHIIPLTRPGASGKMVNVATTHSRCNQRKNNRLPEECINIFPNQRLPERFLAWKQLQE